MRESSTTSEDSAFGAPHCSCLGSPGTDGDVRDFYMYGAWPFMSSLFYVTWGQACVIALSLSTEVATGIRGC